MFYKLGLGVECNFSFWIEAKVFPIRLFRTEKFLHIFSPHEIFNRFNVLTFLVQKAHRKKSYPHTHVPIKAVRTTTATTMNRSSSKDSNSTLTKQDSTPTETPLSTTPNSPISESSNGGGYGNDTVSRPSNFSSYADYTSRDVSENIDEEDPPQLSERAANYPDEEVSLWYLSLERHAPIYSLISGYFRETGAVWQRQVWQKERQGHVRGR